MEEVGTIEFVLMPQAGEDNLLSAEEALEQLRDMIVLMKAQEAFANEKAHDWVIIHASTNSPFRMKVAPRAESENEDLSRALNAAATTYRDIQVLASEGKMPEWADDKVVSILNKVSQRTGKTVGSTNVSFGDAQILKFDATAKTAVLKNLELFRAPNFADLGKHVSIGDVMGKFARVGTYKDQRALWLTVRAGKEVVCLLPEKIAGRFAEHSSLEDVWTNQTVLVFGKKYYDAQGKLSRIEALREPEIQNVEPIPLEQVTDQNFTGGVDAVDYLQKLRGED